LHLPRLVAVVGGNAVDSLVSPSFGDWGLVDPGMDDSRPLSSIRHDITPMFGRMARELFHGQILRCDPDHIPALRGLSTTGRFTFVGVSVIVLNGL
jgi:hypothetical protein